MSLFFNAPLPFIAAAGGLIGTTFDALIVGGGGGSGTNHYSANRDVGGGGGAEVLSQTGQTIAGPYTIQVGQAGAGDNTGSKGDRKGKDGGRSTFNGSTAKAGGGGFSLDSTDAGSPSGWWIPSHTYSPAVQGGGGVASAGLPSISGQTYAGSRDVNYWYAAPSNCGGGAGGAAANSPSPGPGVSSSITGSSIEYGKGGDGIHSNPSTYGSGGGSVVTPNTVGRNGASGVVYVRLFDVSVDQATIDSQLSSASNMTATVSADGSDTVIEFRPTTATTVASVTWTPA